MGVESRPCNANPRRDLCEGPEAIRRLRRKRNIGKGAAQRLDLHQPLMKLEQLPIADRSRAPVASILFREVDRYLISVGRRDGRHVESFLTFTDTEHQNGPYH